VTALLAAGRGSAYATLGVAAWIGAALLTTAVVAPAAFAALPTRALAGALVGRVLPPLFVAGLVLNAAAGASAWRDGGRYAAARIALCTLAAVSCAMAQFVVARRIETLRAAIGPNLDALAAGDPRRVAFGKLHGLSVASLGLAMLAAALVVALTVVAASSDNARAEFTTHPSPRG
jgi:uncharacterized membrane protein